MRVPLKGWAGPCYTVRSKFIDTQELVNFYPEIELPTSKAPTVLIGTPGLELFTNIPDSGAIRGLFSTSSNRFFAVCGNEFHEIKSNGATQFIGNLLTNTGIVSMAENGKQIIIVDGRYGYLFDLVDWVSKPEYNNTVHTAGTFQQILGVTMTYAPPNQAWFTGTTDPGTIAGQSVGAFYMNTTTYSVFKGTIVGPSFEWVYVNTTVHLESGDPPYTTANNGDYFKNQINGDLYLQIPAGFEHVANLLSAPIVYAGFPAASHVIFKDGFFIVNNVGTQQFNISEPYEGGLWDALQYASAEGSPDNIVAVGKTSNEFWLLGDKSTEIWFNAASTPMPFQRITGAFIDVGTVAKNSVASNGNNIFWLGSNPQGQGVVYNGYGYTPNRISTHSIEFMIGTLGKIDDAVRRQREPT